MITNSAQIIIGALCTFPSNANDWLLAAGITHSSIMLDAGGRAVQDAQVVGPGAAVIGGRAVVPHHHHLLRALEATHGADMALAAVLLAPLPVRAAHDAGADPLHHHSVVAGVTHWGPDGGRRRRRGSRERAGPRPHSGRRRGRQRAPRAVGPTHRGGDRAVPEEPSARAGPWPSRPPLRLEARPPRLAGGGLQAEGERPWAGTLPLAPDSPAGLQRRPPANLALPRPGARRAGGGSPGRGGERGGRPGKPPALGGPRPLTRAWAPGSRLRDGQRR